MDIEALKNMNDILTNHFNSTKNDLNNYNNFFNKNSNKDYKPANDITIAKKGDNSYIKQMDLDDDGVITLEEFNKYCEENGVSEEEKIRMLQMMNTSKANSKLVAKAAEQHKSKKDTNKSEEIEDKSIYARKGDDNYNEAMDTNKNDIVTYQEYMEYCNKHSKNKENDKSEETKETQAYSQNEHYEEEPEISVDTEI